MSKGQFCTVRIDSKISRAWLSNYYADHFVDAYSKNQVDVFQYIVLRPKIKAV